GDDAWDRVEAYVSHVAPDLRDRLERYDTAPAAPPPVEPGAEDAPQDAGTTEAGADTGTDSDTGSSAADSDTGTGDTDTGKDTATEGTPAQGPDVFSAYLVDEQIAKALERKVWLPSGGSLVIDRTEAMTVVDVNTGKFTGSGGNLEETVTKNNLEAAEEI